ncbi:MAG: sigma-70 family RNA polymerase sigma factor [Gemmatimonadota bacterium]|jgi:RNA polymerase sigma-70 factor (ECF subfamily)|nr:MAG: sigma-70 family RNA polymerase sigma factor [Gemmatimonadota bacterium]
MATDWAAVYEATYTDLVHFLYRKVWDAQRAEDLAQDAFVRALRHDPERPRAWLFTVASNLARDEARSAVRRRRHLRLIRTELETAPPAASEPADRLDREKRAEAVRLALEALSERDREILLLWDAGLSYREIAEETGLAPGAIGTTLSRARGRLVLAYEERAQRDVASD